MERLKFHMRMVTSNDVCIDVVLRGKSPEDMETVAKKIERFLDFQADEIGFWAGVGRGEFVEQEIKLA